MVLTIIPEKKNFFPRHILSSYSKHGHKMMTISLDYIYVTQYKYICFLDMNRTNKIDRYIFYADKLFRFPQNRIQNRREAILKIHCLPISFRNCSYLNIFFIRHKRLTLVSNKILRRGSGDEYEFTFIFSPPAISEISYFKLYTYEFTHDVVRCTESEKSYRPA